jgi:hypothetical protein
MNDRRRSNIQLDAEIVELDVRREAERRTTVSIDDFYVYLPEHRYLFAPTGDLWPAASVNARLPPIEGEGDKPIAPATWLDRNRRVEQMTWYPGLPKLITNKVIADGGLITKPDSTIFNLYRPPSIVPRPGDVGPWLDLLHKVFPDEADHILQWLAHRVQRPHEKINHALLLGGKPGIGKDTILEPIKQGVGPWNFKEVSPKQVLGSFNGFVKAVVLRVSEARDLGDFDRYAFHDHMKSVIAAPPDVLRVNEKHIREYYVPNLCGVIITTNHKTNGLYLPEDDRRHFVAWSSLSSEDFAEHYWRDLYRWYGSGGHEHVAQYLGQLDLSTTFDAKAPPPKTQAFWEIVNANRAPEDSELADVLDDLGRPDITTLDAVASRAGVVRPALAEWLRDRKNRRNIPHRFEACGYVAVNNPHDKGGMWKIDGVRHTLYGSASLTERDRLAAAFTLAGRR